MRLRLSLLPLVLAVAGTYDAAQIPRAAPAFLGFRVGSRWTDVARDLPCADLWVPPGLRGTPVSDSLPAKRCTVSDSVQVLFVGGTLVQVTLSTRERLEEGFVRAASAWTRLRPAATLALGAPDSVAVEPDDSDKADGYTITGVTARWHRLPGRRWSAVARMSTTWVHSTTFTSIRTYVAVYQPAQPGMFPDLATEWSR